MVVLICVPCPNVFSGILFVRNVPWLFVQIGDGVGIQLVCDMSGCCAHFCSSGCNMVCVVCKILSGYCLVCHSCHVCAMWGLFWFLCQAVRWWLSLLPLCQLFVVSSARPVVCPVLCPSPYQEMAPICPLGEGRRFWCCFRCV